MKRFGYCALFAVLTAVLAAALVPMAAADANQSDPRVVITEPDLDNPTITVNAQSSVHFTVVFFNTNAYLEHDYTDEIWINVVPTVLTSDGSKYKEVTATAKVDGSDSLWVLLKGRAMASFEITITQSKYAHQDNNYVLAYTYSVKNYDESGVVTQTTTHPLTIKSSLSTAGNYNKILGIFENPLPDPFNHVQCTALITIILWLLVGAAITVVAVPVVTRLACTDEDPYRPKFKVMLTRWSITVTIVYALVNTLCVLGVSESTISLVKTYANLLYLAIFSYILWRIYTTLLNRISQRMRRNDPGSEARFDAFKPLFVYLGEIITAIAVVFIGMGMLGFDLTAAVTSAGIVSLGITFGAQQVLAQFFAGLVILSTRPFREGDLLQLGTNTQITYRVRKVTVMFTELENWDNSDITIVPNNTLTSSNIKNITRDTLRTKVHLFMEVSYDSDLAFVRQTMLEVANANPRIIKDGSVSRPATRVTSFNASNIEIRLTVWVDDYNDSFAIAGELRAALFKKFNEVGITISYDQVVVNYADETGPATGVPKSGDGPAKSEKDTSA